jgi:hypothetical protein
MRRAGGWRGGNLDVMADALGEWFATEDFRGCSFINMIAEAGGGAGDDPRLLAQAVAHKASLEDFVTGIARDLGLSDPRSGGRGHALHRGHDRPLPDHACRSVWRPDADASLVHEAYGTYGSRRRYAPVTLTHSHTR